MPIICQRKLLILMDNHYACVIYYHRELEKMFSSIFLRELTNTCNVRLNVFSKLNVQYDGKIYAVYVLKCVCECGHGI